MSLYRLVAYLALHVSRRTLQYIYTTFFEASERGFISNSASCGERGVGKPTPNRSG